MSEFRIATDVEVAAILQKELRQKLVEYLSKELSRELRDWWSFDERQQHTHSWHTREDFIERLPKLLDTLLKGKQ